MEATVIKKSHGANVRWWRDYREMTQETLAELAGFSQAAISGYENKDKLEPDVLEKIAKALDVPVEAITERGSENPINIFSGTWSDHSVAQNYYPTFNPFDKVVELYEQKEALYERMLQAEKEKVILLQETLRDLDKK